jgi:hypothetical protein
MGFVLRCMSQQLAHRVELLRCEGSDAIERSGHAESVGSGSI